MSLTLEEMEKRLQAVEAVEEIKQVTNRYVNCLMFADWDNVMESFWDDCVFDVFVEREKTQGKEIIEKTLREVVSLKHQGNEGDMLSHPLITVDGDKATGKWIIYFFTADPDEWRTPGWIKGIYDIEYKKKNGKWKFSMIKWRPFFPPGMQMPPGGGPPPMGKKK